MPKTININSGCYLLEVYAPKKFVITNKTFANISFEKGYYYYTGSAQKSLSKRILRHIKKEKTLYWHIDYITSHKDLTVSNIFIFPAAPKSFECRLTQALGKHLSFPVKNFGSGDCNTCYSHLLYSPTKIDYNHFSALYQSTVRFIPSSNEISWL